MLRLLALDFDGVISDSAPEAYIVALRTYAELRPGSRLVERSGVASQGALIPPDAGDETYRRFLELMPLGNRAEDYAISLLAIDAGEDLPDQAAYDAFRGGLDAGWLREYHRRFYRTRTALSRADPEAWLKLMAPYSRFLELLRRRGHEVELAIATSKDRRSVRELLRAYGIDSLFGEDRVLDKETGASKTAHLEHLHRATGVEFPEITFVDDKVNHLDAVRPLGVRCALAAWGYNGARELAEAGRRGHLICHLEDAEARLFG